MGPKKMTGGLKRVVIDTNVLVSALLFDGVPGELIGCWRQGKILPLASRDIINEFIRVLSYPKFQLNEEEIKFLLNQEILPWFEIVTVKKQNPFVIDDPDDDKFIWCALAGRADYIISGDEHLLNLNSSPIPILSPAKFIGILKTT
jgi:putative PIN family toxin of toxin-antitoxin system